MNKHKNKTKNSKLSQKAYDAFKILQDTTYGKRIEALENAEEFGFALLIYWNRVELALKLRQYYNNIDTFPDKLDFIDKRIAFIRCLYQIDTNCYDCVLNGKNSIWKIRNKIAHDSFVITKTDYEIYKPQIISFEINIRSLIPERISYLNVKRNIK